MKTSKIILIAVSALSLITTQSCLKESNDIFEESCSERVANYIDNVKTILEGQESGWIMEMYPGVDQKFGGYVFHVKFKDGKVTARCEFDPEYEETSYYKITNDNAPVLSFDLHNELLHYFATPSPSAYEAMGGDFEFSIKNFSQEKVSLIGKRSGNHCDLYSFTSELTPEEYLNGVCKMGESVLAATVSGTIGGKEVNGELDLDTRRITFKYYDPEEAARIAAQNPSGEDEEEESEDDEKGYVTKAMPYTYTPTGIKAYQPITIAGNTLDDFMYHAENNIFSNGVFNLQGKVPDDYTNFADFAGVYTLAYYTSSKATVTLTANEERTGYVMSGLNKNYTVFLKYNKSKGRLIWNAQVVGKNGDNMIWLAAWDLNGGGSLTWDEAAGTEIHWVPEHNCFEFESNKDWEGHSTDSFVLWETDGNGNSIGSFSGWGNGQIPYLKSLTRK